MKGKSETSMRAIMDNQSHFASVFLVSGDDAQRVWYAALVVMHATAVVRYVVMMRVSVMGITGAYAPTTRDVAIAKKTAANA